MIDSSNPHRLFERISLVIACLLAGILGGSLFGRTTVAPILPAASPSAAASSPTPSATLSSSSPSELTRAAALALASTVVVLSSNPGTLTGSGTLVGSDGLILTDRHVVHGFSTIEIELPGSTIPQAATVLALDSLTDLALLRLVSPPLSPLPALSLGSSDALSMGAPLAVVGDPLGSYPGTLTVGVLSGRARTLTLNDGSVLYDLLQVDAAVSPGMSGGPVVDVAGNLIGIVSSIVEPLRASGLSFVLPIEVAKALIEEAKTGKPLARASLGLSFRVLGADEAKGAGVTPGAVLLDGTANSPAIDPGGPAERAGLRAGDIITAIAGIAVSEASPYAFSLSRAQPGVALKIEIRRTGTAISLSITPDAMLLPTS